MRCKTMRLHEQVKHKDVLLETYSEWIIELERHLNLPKFYEDTSIQVADIKLRVNELKVELFKLDNQ